MSGLLWIPVNKRELAEEALDRELSKFKCDNLNPENIQESYNFFEQALNTIAAKFGINKNMVKTEDKLSRETKNLINKRSKIRSRTYLNIKEQIELTELRKVIKKKIWEDIKKFENKLTQEIIESTWSTKNK